MLLNASLHNLQAQYINESFQSDTLTVLFYNVENLFDDVDDPSLGDDEFSKKGIRAWNGFKYKSKIKKISQVILAANNWEATSIIGLAEIENRNVLKELTSSSLLSRIGYKILHKESPDHRGIDVGLLYDPKKIVLLDSAFYEIELAEQTYSRDILYAKMKIHNDILHVFVCHWPSRFGGALSSENNRMIASEVLLNQCKRLLTENENSKFFIMGDFNDEPKDKSLSNLHDKLMLNNQAFLHNLMDNEFDLGTIKFQNQWYLFDQFLISNDLLKNDFGLQLYAKSQICSLPFLLVKDEKYLGIKPFRTFSGYRFIGGYSDHLPILVRLIYH